MQLQLLNGPFVSPSLSWKKKGINFYFYSPLASGHFPQVAPGQRKSSIPCSNLATYCLFIICLQRRLESDPCDYHGNLGSALACVHVKNLAIHSTGSAICSSLIKLVCVCTWLFPAKVPRWIS